MFARAAAGMSLADSGSRGRVTFIARAATERRHLEGPVPMNDLPCRSRDRKPLVYAPLGRLLSTFFVAALVIAATLQVADAATQTLAVSSCADTGSPTGTGWTNPTNAQTSNDIRATTGTLASGAITHYLQCTAFGFSIPAGSTILGIQVEWDRQNSSNGAIQ